MKKNKKYTLFCSLAITLTIALAPPTAHAQQSSSTEKTLIKAEWVEDVENNEYKVAEKVSLPKPKESKKNKKRKDNNKETETSKVTSATTTTTSESSSTTETTSSVSFPQTYKNSATSKPAPVPSTQGSTTTKPEKVVVEKAEVEKVEETKEIAQVKPSLEILVGRKSDDPHEDVIYDGEKTETITLTDEQKKEFDEKGYFTYEPDMKKVTEYLIQYITELRSINGIDLSVAPYGEEGLEYAKFRAEEQLSNPKDEDGTPSLSHDTSDDIIRQNENLVSFPTTFISNRDTNSKILSDQQFAYYLALSWFADYHNVAGAGYGHRLLLMFGVSDVQGVGMSSFVDEKHGQNGNLYLYVSQNGVDRTDSWDWDNLYWSADALEQQVTYDDNNTMFFRGERVKFLPDTTFVYSTETND